MKFKKIIILLIIAISTSCLNVYADNKSDDIKNEIDNNNSLIEDLKDEVEGINNQIKDENNDLVGIEEKISEVAKELESIQVKVSEYQMSIDEVQSEINEIENQVNKLQEEIYSKKEKIEELKIEEMELQELTDNRIRNYYKIDMTKQYVYMIIKSENVFDIFQNISKIFKLMQFDRDLISKTKENQKNIALEAEALSNSMEEQKEKQKIVKNKRSELEIAQSEYLIAKEDEERRVEDLQYLQYEKENLIALLEEREQSINSNIDSLLAYNTELQAELDNIFNDINNSGNNNDDIIDTLPESNGFLRPVNGVITCHYGERTNPVTGEYGFHNGIDYGNDTGTPILASKSGIVSYSGWISGYGNTIILDHGNGEQTLYAHANSLTVGVGEAIAQGQEVAKVGSTGMSTGPHLHFEIRINGTPVNPFEYIPY